MESFHVRFVCVLGAILFLTSACWPSVARAEPADDCADCRAACAVARVQGEQTCDDAYDLCYFGCLMFPFEVCEEICLAVYNVCSWGVGLRFADCMNRCRWWPCCDNNPCDDGLFCNGLEWCAAEVGACTAGEPVVCESDDQFCNGLEACDETAAQCVSPGDPCAPGGACDEATDSCTPIADDDDDDADDDDNDADDDDDNDLGDDDDDNDVDADDDSAADDDLATDDDDHDAAPDDDDGGCGC